MTRLVEIREHRPRYRAQRHAPGEPMDAACGIEFHGEQALLRVGGGYRVVEPGDWIVVCQATGYKMVMTDHDFRARFEVVDESHAAGEQAHEPPAMVDLGGEG